MTTPGHRHRRRHRFTVQQYHRMGDAGVFEDERVELLDGEIYEMTPIGSGHAGHVNRLNTLLHRQLADRFVISVQNPVELGEYSEPEPDVAVLRPRDDSYAGRHPTAGDILLLIEVAETSLEDDRSKKIPIYAEHGIPHVWLVNLRDETVERYAAPSDGSYEHRENRRGDDELTVDALPDLALTPADILV